MARTLVITFSDNDAAESFARIFNEVQNGVLSAPVRLAFNEMGLILSGYGTMQALVAHPTVYCTCNVPDKQKAWTKTRRFGWRVHTACNKPSKLFVLNFIQYMLTSAGNNLLQEALDAAEPTRADDTTTRTNSDSNNHQGNREAAPSVSSGNGSVHSTSTSNTDTGQHSNRPDDGGNITDLHVTEADTPSPVEPASGSPQGADEGATSFYGEWVSQPECTALHNYGEPGWRKGPEGQAHEHWIPSEEDMPLVIRPKYTETDDV